MANKSDFAVKVGVRCKTSASDIWERVIVDEKVDMGNNFGQTRQVKPGKSRKVHHYNYDAIPAIEKKVATGPSAESACTHIERRILSFEARNATLVRHISDVAEEEGAFPHLPQSALTSFLLDPLASSLYPIEYLLPFRNAFSVDDFLHILQYPPQNTQLVSKWMAGLPSGDPSARPPTSSTIHPRTSNEIGIECEENLAMLVNLHRNWGWAQYIRPWELRKESLLWPAQKRGSRFETSIQEAIDLASYFFKKVLMVNHLGDRGSVFQIEIYVASLYNHLRGSNCIWVLARLGLTSPMRC